MDMIRARTLGNDADGSKSPTPSTSPRGRRKAQIEEKAPEPRNDEWKADLEAVRAAFNMKLESVDKRLSADVSRLNSTVEKLEASLKRRLDSQESELKLQIANLATEVQDTKSTYATAARVDETAQQLRTLQEESSTQLSARIDEQQQSLLEARQASQAELAAEAGHRQALEERARGLESSVATLDKLIANNVGEWTVRSDAAAQDRARIVELCHEVETKAAARRTEITVELERLARELAKHQHQAKEQQEVMETATQERLSALALENKRSIANNQDLIADLRSTLNEAASCSTRRVEWLIRDAEALLTQGDSGGEDAATGWLSPRFEAAGVSGLQLELSVSRPPQENSSKGGNCALRLWGPEGLYLVCRFHVGGATSQRRHTFGGEEAAPCESGSLGLLKDHISAESGTLLLGVEILESVWEVRAPIGGEEQAEASEEASGRLAGEITFHRYLNHRTLDLVQDQVELMRSRMVRRVEWDIKQASMLQQCFPAGECVCSTTFEAAGIEGLQLVFYPSGYEGARQGWCSYFVHCPAGSSLRCALWAGRQRREAKLAFEKQGYFGRTNFCRFDQCVDAHEDVVPLVLEIDEAQQSVTEVLSHQPMSREVSPGSPTPPRTPQQPQQQQHGQGRQPDRIGSSLRLRRAPGRQELEDVRQLPSIWTAKPLTNVAEALEGFRSFNDIKAPPSSARSQQGGQYGASALCLKTPSSARGGRHNRSAAAGGLLDVKYSMYAA